MLMTEAEEQKKLKQGGQRGQLGGGGGVIMSMGYFRKTWDLFTNEPVQTCGQRGQ